MLGGPGGGGRPLTHPGNASSESLRFWLGLTEYLAWHNASAAGGSGGLGAMLLFSEAQQLVQLLSGDDAAATLQDVSRAAVATTSVILRDAELAWSRVQAWVAAAGVVLEGRAEQERMWRGDPDVEQVGSASGICVQGVREGGRGADCVDSGELEAGSQCLRASSTEVLVLLSMDRSGLGLLRLSSLHSLTDAVSSFCQRAYAAARARFTEQDCIFVREEVLTSSRHWARWRWPGLVDETCLVGFTNDLGKRLHRFQPEAFATLRYHAS